jgi:glutamate-1-semialdehyde aminotransferase
LWLYHGNGRRLPDFSDPWSAVILGHGDNAILEAVDRAPANRTDARNICKPIQKKSLAVSTNGTSAMPSSTCSSDLLCGQNPSPT